jgi:predicted RNase H-like HicB family nuclease
MQITARLSGLIRRDKTVDRLFVSFCPALNVYSQGASEREAMRALQSAVFLFLTTCYERRMLGQFLQDRGFCAVSESPAVPLKDYAGEFVSVQDSKDEFDKEFPIEVPMYLVAQSKGTQCLH